MSILLIGAALLTAAALVMLSVVPALGMSLVFLVRPIVDATWDQMVIWELNLPRLLSVVVPLIVMFHMGVTARGSDSLRHLPMRVPWIGYSAYCLLFSVTIFVQESPLIGVEVFFRHINGIVGFFVVQAYFRDPVKLERLLGALLVAGLFPLLVGLYQIVTGSSLNEQETEGLIRRVGFYHDGFTVRFYMMQTLLSAVLYGTLFLDQRRWMFLPLLMITLGALLVVFFAYSKSAIATLAMWAVIWVILRRNLAAFGLALCGVLGLLLVGQGAFLESLATLFRKELLFADGEIGVERIFAGRLYGWADLVSQWNQLTPAEQWFGAGRRATDAHNDYLQLLIHGGIVGLALYIGVLAAVGYGLLRRVWSGDRLAIVGTMAFAMWLIDSIGLVPSSYPGYQWFVWGLIGLALRGLDAEDIQPAADKQRTSNPATRRGQEQQSEARHHLALPRI